MIQIKKRPPMPWYQKTFYILSFVFLISAFIYLGTKNYNAPIKKMTDHESFTQEFGITNENLFIYKNAKEVLELFNTGTGIVFFAFPENEWSSSYADILNDAAKSLNIENIWYYNFKSDRANNNHYYRNIVKQLSHYLPILDTGDANLYAPTVVFVKNGVVVGYDNETAIVNGDVTVNDYWTRTNQFVKKQALETLIRDYLGVSDETD